MRGESPGERKVTLMNRVRIVAALVAAGVGLGLVSASVAQEKREAVDDRTFVMKASAAGLAGINLAMQAEKQSSNEEVKKFARHIVRDHTKANEELNKLADKKRLTVARTMDQKHTRMATRLAGMTGEAFDRDFVRQMVADHDEAVQLFEAEAKNGQDADLKEFASKTLPTLKEHRKMARDLAKTVGVKEKSKTP
jgi:putative membrane protein